VLNLAEIKDGYQTEIYRWEPIKDAPPVPSIQWLHDQVQFIETQRQNNKKVYVHCQQGVSRSGMVVTAYLMSKNQWTRDQALEYIRTKRPPVRPNRAFMELLLEWEQILNLKPETRN
jgi:protein-tyrosine phosphatase